MSADLDDFHHSDGRPVSFDREKVALIEPHEDGEGTRVLLVYEGGSRDLHLREAFEPVKARLTESTMARTLRYIDERPGQRPASVFDNDLDDDPAY